MARARFARGWWCAAAVLAGCARTPARVEPSDAGRSHPVYSAADGEPDDADADMDARATREPGESLVLVFRDELARGLPPSRAAALAPALADARERSVVAPRRLAYFVVDYTARGILANALEPAASRRAVRMRAMRPIASVHGLEALRVALGGAEALADGHCDGGGCDEGARACAARASSALYEAMEDLESAEEDAMESQRWWPDGARYHASREAETVGRAGEAVAEEAVDAVDTDLYRVAMRSAARAVIAACACGADNADADVETLRALVFFARTGASADAGR